MNQPEFLLELAALLKKHSVAICAPGVTIPKDVPSGRNVYTHIEFIHTALLGSNYDETISSSRMHLTSYEITRMYERLKQK
jgi:hypothetical protein